MQVFWITSFVCFLLGHLSVKGEEVEPCNPCSECDFDLQRCNADVNCVFMPLNGTCLNRASEESGCDADVLYGGVKFYKIGEEDTSSHGCMDGNVYEREGAEGSRICFKKDVGSLNRECSADADFTRPLRNTRFQGTVLTTIKHIKNATACLRLCAAHSPYAQGFSYDTWVPGTEECILFSQISGSVNDDHWISAYYTRSDDDSCLSQATSIGITHCGDDCETSAEDCRTCIAGKLEGNCSNLEDICIFNCNGEPFKCVYDLGKCGVECAAKSDNPFDIAECVVECVPGECDKYVCNFLGKWPTAKQACICTPTVVPKVEKCRKDNPNSWPDTVECSIEQLLDSSCSKLLCDLMKYLFPEVPEAVQICNCALPIITSVQKCHDQYGSDWAKVAECVAKVVGKDCEKYLCKYAGKIFPPILQVPFCKSKARLQ